MMRIYFYKLVVDNGGAPCIGNNLLSLAICKPMIRAAAELGDIIFGFAASSMDADNRLLYIAEVTGKEKSGNYFRSGQHSHRSDCIYTWDSGGFRWRQGALYHGPEHLAHDLGPHPGYDRANVLLSDNFRYLGGSGTSGYKNRYPLVKEAVEDLGRGHRVNHAAQLRSELLRLKVETWAEFSKKICGRPSNPLRRNVCQRSRSCGVV